MGEDDFSEALDEHKPKRRRLRGACDTCRKRKIKCDSATMPGNSCTNCQMYKSPCTHDLPRQPKKKEVQQAYLTNLEGRLDRMEGYLQSLHPEKDIDILIGIRDGHSQHTSEPSQLHPIPVPAIAATASSSTPFTTLRYPVPPPSSERLPEPAPLEDAAEDVDISDTALAEHLDQLSLTDHRFYGPASEFMFAQSALSLKQGMTGVSQVESAPPKRPGGSSLLEMRPWELEFLSSPHPVYVFPEDDLLQSLVSLYFERPNIFLPIIHKPTFLKSLAAGQHLRDSGFGMTVLMVCAMGARYSNDRRVLQDGDDTWISSGWKWFSQIPIHRNSLLQRTTAYDLQYYCLAVVFLGGTNMSQTAWSFVGMGIRLALENGIHRRRGQNGTPSPEDEHLKRAFWCLVCIDRFMSSSLGRPSSIADEDFDVDYPVECDDEYWETEDPEQTFKQPPGKPCQLSAFICHIKLCEILAFALRTLYSTKKSKMLTGLMGAEWEQRLVEELDSSLNKWEDSLPHYLKWQWEMPDATFFHQSSCLHATYYYVRIQIHRPFLMRKSPLTKTSLTMCTSAARECCRVLETTSTRGMRSYHVYFLTAFSSAIVLLINMWGAQLGDNQVDQAEDIENIQWCFRVLKDCAKRWHLAGRLHEKLTELGPLQERCPPAMPKRRRDDLNASISNSHSQTSHATGPSANSSMAWNFHLAETAAGASYSTMAQPGFAYSSSGPSTSTHASSSSPGISTPSVQLQQQHLVTTDPMHFPHINMYKSAASIHADDWNFISHVLQGRSQQQPQFGASSGTAPRNPDSSLGRTPDVQVGALPIQRPLLPKPFASSDPTSHNLCTPTIPHNASASSIPFQNSNAIAQEFTINSETQIDMSFPLVDNVFGVWSDAPVAFNAQDWDSYLFGIFDKPSQQQQ